MLAFVDELVRGGYRESSILTMLAGVRALFRAIGQPWPLEGREIHLGLPEVDPEAPVLPPQDIVRLIAAARRGPPIDQAPIALATVWGLRASEILRLLAVGHTGQELRLQTSKRGRERRHQVPAALVPVLTFPARELARPVIYDVLGRVASRAGVVLAPRAGWHSVRRSVVTGLLEAGVDELDLHRWCGWRSLKGEEAGAAVSAMARLYYRPDDRKVDARILARHPFLPFWQS